MVQLLILVILVAALAAFAVWAWVIEKRIEPAPDRPGHEGERFHFKYGGEPPTQGGIDSGTISGAS